MEDKENDICIARFISNGGQGDEAELSVMWIRRAGSYRGRNRLLAQAVKLLKMPF